MRPIILLIVCLSIMSASCKKGDKVIAFGPDKVYYVSPVEEETALKVGTFLQQYKYFVGNGAVVQLVEDSVFTARFATHEGIEKDAYIIDGFIDMQLEMSVSIFDGAPVNIQLCDSTLTTKGSISFEDARAWIEGKAYVEK
ncbi:MAG TPA: hypothetical protein PK511_13390 [Chitinophagales bacterium]|nr:hypothetical protein [Chitinophagales bacterium]HNA58051.1 hypothetical protein [Chitinophagales bacterium]HNE47224.1 hypothetical protein [Chitinophagales bacterium]HNF70032.1 hypothetical protein [Chitinophagales bacterium]HNI55513.1 hypothetical protein [Chitinophagales bacterium]